MIDDIKNFLWLRESEKNRKLYGITPPERIFPKINDLLKRINKPNNQTKILDASGGNFAKTTLYLAEKGYDVFYSEVSKDLINFTKSLLKKVDKNLSDAKNRCILSYFEDLPKFYGSYFFDAVISIMTIHRGNWDYINKSWKGISEIIAKNGFLLMVFHRYSPKGKIFSFGVMKDHNNKLINIPALDNNHPHNKYSFIFKKGVNHFWRDEIFHTYTKDEIIELCNKNNLKIVFLKKIKMFATESPYWYLLAKKI